MNERLERSTTWGRWTVVVIFAIAMAYLESNHPSAIITKKTISLSTVRSLIFSEGEAVPGVEAELGRDSLYLKPRA